MFDYVNSIEHTCELSDDPAHFSTPPTASWWRVQASRLGALAGPCAWHHGVGRYLRSRLRFRRERERRARGGRGTWHPYSPVKYAADCAYLLLVFGAYMYMPLQVFYPDPNPYDPFILFVDTLSVLNMCTRCITGYVEGENKIIVLEPRRTAAHYLRTYFVTDLIGALPLQLVTHIDQYPCSTVMLVFKLFRIFTIREQWKNVVGQFQLPHVQYVSVTMLVQLLMFFQWMTYVHYQVPSFCKHFYDDHEVSNWLHRTEYYGNNTAFQKYTSNLFQVSGLAIGAGHYRAEGPHIIPDRLLTAGMTVAGLLFLSHAFTTLVSVAIYSQYESYIFNGRYKELEDHTRHLRLPLALRKKISLFVNYKFNGHYFNEAAIVGTLNEQIRRDISLHCCKRLLLNVPLCRGLPAALAHALVFALRRLLYMPAETIVKCGDEGVSMFLISSGTVAVMTDTGKEVAHLRDGSYFGENSLIQTSAVRTATIIALEITEIYNLSKKDFYACLQPYPHLKRRILEKGNSMRRSTMGRAR